VLTVMEFVLRRSLQHEQAHLPGLHPGNGRKMTNTPTAERILQAFPEVSLTILQTATGEEIRRWLTPLSALRSCTSSLRVIPIARQSGTIPLSPPV
jgi:hypothetical protein